MSVKLVNCQLQRVTGITVVVKVNDSSWCSQFIRQQLVSSSHLKNAHIIVSKNNTNQQYNMESTTTYFNIGILGCANIAKKNCRAAKKSSCNIYAVSSRSQEKAHNFIKEVLSDQESSTKVYAGESDSYSQLLRDTGMKAVYIPLPTKLHEQYVANALSLNKHVLLEKPVAVSSTSYREMLSSASQNKKLLMDGTMFIHHPRTKQFITSISNPNRVTFNFTFDGTKDGGRLDSNFFKNDIRQKKDGDFLGCVGDLGWYCVRMGLLVFSAGDASALKGMVTGAQVVRYQLNEEGVPYDADCLVYFTEVSTCCLSVPVLLIHGTVSFWYLIPLSRKLICYFHTLLRRIESYPFTVASSIH